MYKKIVVGVDQSYQNTGISIFADGSKKKIKSIQLERYSNNSEKRRVLRENLGSLLSFVAEKEAKETILIFERIRLHSQGFLNIDYIKSMGALNSILIDTALDFNIPAYSVDTRAWKSQVIGTSKPKNNKYGVPPEKWPTIEWCIRNGWESDLIIEILTRKEKGTFIRDGKKLMYNNDAADSAGICMFGFVGNPDNLKLEK